MSGGLEKLVRKVSGGETALARKARDGVVFDFRYRGFLFAGQAESEMEGGRVRLHANLGSLPYTIESRYRRDNALAIVTAASEALGGRLTVTPAQHIILMDDNRLDEPLSPRLLMASAVRLVLLAKPYLELLSVVVDPPGTARTQTPGAA